MTLIPPNVAALIHEALRIEVAIDGQKRGTTELEESASAILPKLTTALEAAYATPSPARSLPTVETLTRVIESQTASYDPVTGGRWPESLKRAEGSDMSEQAARAVLALLAREGEAGQ